MAGKSHKSVQQKKAVLAAFEECGHVGRACRAAKVGRRTHYDWLQSDAQYAADFEIARKVALIGLEDEARRRAVDGVQRLKFYKGELIMVPDPNDETKLIPYVEHEYDTTALIFLLKSNDPEKYREIRDVRHSGDVAIHHEGAIKLIEDDDWYRNGAHDRLTQAAAASNSGAAQPGQIQGRGLRPKVGQNGNGSAGQR